MRNHDPVANPTPATRLHRIADALSRTNFFVVGCQKSGTTWVQRLLNGHPQACCHGESRFASTLIPSISQSLKTYNDAQKAGELGCYSQADLFDLSAVAIGLRFAAWIETCGKDPAEILAIGEKTPEHARGLDILDTALPGMRAIHVVRDPRDVVVSGWHHNLRQNHHKFSGAFPTMAKYAEYTLQHHWLPYVIDARAWGAIHPNRYCEVRFASLVHAPLPTLRRLLAFLDLDHSNLAIHQCQRAGEPAKADAAPKSPITWTGKTSGSFYRRGIPGAWRDELPEAAQRVIEDLAGEHLNEFAATSTVGS